MQIDTLSLPPELQGLDLSNWRKPPFSRWAFQHIDQLIPTAPVASGGTKTKVVRAAASVEAVERFAGFDQLQVPAGAGVVLSLRQLLQRTATDGFLVMHDGRIVHEFYDNGTTAHTQHILMSATKSIVGLVVGILHAKGQLDVDALVSSYVPEIADTVYAGATVRHLLDMRSGAVFDKEQSAAYAASTGWEPESTARPSRGMHAFFEHVKAPPGAHGGAFSYVSANTDLLGWVIERASGQRFSDLVSMLLWKPMGAAHDGYITVDAAGAPRCTGGMGATLRDFAAVGQSMVDSGEQPDGAVLPADWLDDIARNGDADAWKQGEFAKAFGSLKMRYRSGWYVIDDEPKTLFAMGIHGQHLFVDAAHRLVVAKFSSQELPIDPGAIGLTLAAVGAIRKAVSGTT